VPVEVLGFQVERENVCQQRTEARKISATPSRLSASSCSALSSDLTVLLLLTIVWSFPFDPHVKSNSPADPRIRAPRIVTPALQPISRQFGI
jgi:hypothetical protein